jgi:ribonucleoside-diphosphate reductase alpha chain
MANRPPREFTKTPVPEDLKNRHIPLTDNARTVLERRYLRRGEDGKPVETEQEMFWRVAYHIAKAEEELGGDEAQVEAWARKFYDLLTNLRFFPNSPTFTGAGTPLGQLAACFVLAIEDDMGRTGSGIFETLRHAALIQQTGGGNGFSFSRLRPSGAIVKSSNGTATGPIGFLRVYDQAFGEIAQGGCLTPDTLVYTQSGTLRLDEIVTHTEGGWREHELTVSTDEGERLSTQTYNNGMTDVLKLTTREGIDITGTPNHKFKVMTSTGTEWKRLDELQPGDSILVKLGQHQGTWQTLQHPEQQHGNQVMPQFPTVLDEELAFFLGYMAGDGFVASGEKDHRTGVSVAHDSYLIKAWPQLMSRLFGEDLQVHVMQKDNDASVNFIVDNRALKDFLVMNGLSKGISTDVEVPRLIRQSPANVVGAFLQGLFEADGAISHHYPSLLSSSELLIRQVATLLIGLGSPVRIHRQSPSNDRYGTAPMWVLRINSYVGLQAWKENISCHPASRFAVCKDFEPDLTREVTYVLPEAEYWVEPVLAATQLAQVDARGRGTSTNFRSSDPGLRRRLLRYKRGDRNLTASSHAHLSAEYPSFAQYVPAIDDTWFVTVDSVEDAGQFLTLDIEVEGNHTYLANGLVTHNSRRGANMAVLRVDHPDVRDFIKCKSAEGDISNFNISVGITDKFMQAVIDDTTFDLINPQDGSVWETVEAREIFDMIVEYAHHNGEPGVLFLDAANRENPVPHLYELEATNPCGEQWLGPFENCCLGSVNLAQHYTDNGQVNWAKLQESIELATRFLDNVVTVNAYVPAIPELREAAERVRRIGLGIMGLSDLMFALGVRYGSPEGQEFASQVMEFVRYHSMRTSIELAKKRGPFLGIEGSIYDPKDIKWTAPVPLVEHKSDWNRPALDWDAILNGIKANGIRNGAQLTVAPTGTIATVTGCEGYGCEPVFALAYMRYVNANAGNTDDQITLQYTSPLFEKALIEAGLDEDARQRVIEQVNKTGSCQDIEEIPEDVRHVFAVASDINVEEHIRTQAALQAHVDNAISKTINAPAEATLDDVAAAYKLGWELGCKGLTVYVTGSREKVVLETAETKARKDGVELEPAIVEPVADVPFIFNQEKKPRPRLLTGYTYRTPTPAGTTYITINENGHGKGQPFEVFMHTEKAGSEIAAVSEAMGRLMSLILRLSSPVSPRNRVKQIERQLRGIGGGRQLGFGPNRVASLPDGVSQVLREYLDDTEKEELTVVSKKTLKPDSLPYPADIEYEDGEYSMKIGDLCPECGQAAYVREEGCRRCYSCGFSEC